MKDRFIMFYIFLADEEPINLYELRKQEMLEYHESIVLRPCL